MIPKVILVADENGGYIKATLIDKELETPDEEPIYLYKWVEYYHSLESALKDM